MRKMVSIICGYCGKTVEKQVKEIDRQKRKGRTIFFCDSHCSACSRGRYPTVRKICPECGVEFDSIYHHGKYKQHCSRTCANKYVGRHLDDSAREARSLGIKEAWKAGKYKNNSLSIDTTAASLRKREWWKYEKLSAALEALQINYLFEVPFSGYPPDEYSCGGIVCDLVIISLNLVIEFDGKDHTITNYQLEYDRRRDLFLQSQGYSVLRVACVAGEAIDPAIVLPFIT